MAGGKSDDKAEQGTVYAQRKTQEWPISEMARKYENMYKEVMACHYSEGHGNEQQ